MNSFGVVCLIFLFSFLLWIWKRLRHNDPYSIGAACSNPSCARCQNYRKVQREANRKIRWISSSSSSNCTERILRAVRNGRRQNARQLYTSAALGQYPTVLLVPSLVTHPNVTAMHLAACRTLKMSSREILSEFTAAYGTDAVESSWKHNDTPSSIRQASPPWTVLHLMNQGRWDSSLSRLFPETIQCVKSIPNLLDHSCIFGNVFFSRLGANTTIEPHCGPTNVRHRMHLTIRWTGTISPKLYVRDEEPFVWKTYEVFVFDDSLLHRVDSGDAERVVLIVDLWHPDLSSEERSVISHLYPMARRD